MRALKGLGFVVAVSLLTVACGEWTAPLPTAPSDTSKGATISGTVKGMESSAASTTPSSRAFATLLAALDTITFARPVEASTANTITVTVVGTSITATLNGSGKFVLTSVPSGNIQLQFSGTGVNATIAINGVQPEHIQLVVTLNGSNASIDSMNRVQMDNNAEVEGLITSISHGDRSMKVNGFEIKVRDAPIYQGTQRVDISTLSVGQRVRIKGMWVHDYVVATEVMVNPGSTPTPTPTPTPPPTGGSGDTIEGPIASISHGDRSMKINGLEIKVWDAPIYQGSQRVGISMLAVGQRVRVKGTWVHDYLVAQEVFIL